MSEAKSAADDFDASGRFSLRRRLGAGGFGTVYEALDRERGAVVALKLLRRDNPEALYRFKREFRALADLVHPNLVTLYELLSEGGRWFFTMERVEGEDFLSHVRPEGAPAALCSPDRANMLAPTLDPSDLEGTGAPRPAVDASPVRLDRLCAALIGLAEGLLVLHRAGKLHCDLKPANVLCTPAGRVVILDFGLAADLLPAGDGKSSQHIAGTPEYMSPEQAMGAPLSEASDWYSVGVMLFEALLGRPPFAGPPILVLLQKQREDPPAPSQERPDVPPLLDALCQDLLRRDPAGRPSGAEVLARLRAAAALLADAQPGPEDPADPAPARRAPVAIVGRAAHLRVLAEAYEESRNGRLVAVLCHGSSGMGKSTLLRHFLKQLAERDGRAALLPGRCYEHEALPFKAVDGVIDALSRFLRRLPQSEAEAVLPRDAQALCRLFPVLQQVPAIAAAPRRALSDERLVRQAAFSALRDLLGRLCDRRPVVVVIDDLQWGDRDSVDLLCAALRPPDPPPMLLLLAYRSEEAASSPAVAGLRAALAGEAGAAVVTRELPVAELVKEEARELVAALLGQATAPADPGRVQALAAEGRGSPFFLTELARFADLPQGGAASLDALLDARVQALPEPSRRLLTVVALAGQPLLRECAARAAFAAPERSMEPKAVAELRAAHLLRSMRVAEGEALLPYHDRVRETVVRGLPPADARAHHGRLAQVLEATGTDPERLVFHFQEAGDQAGATRHAVQAALLACDALAFDRGIRLCRAALSLGSLAEEDAERVRTRLCEALTAAGRTQEAARAYLDLAARAAPAAALRYKQRAAGQLLVGGYTQQGMALLKEVLEAVGLGLPRTALGALVTLLLLRLWLLVRGQGFRIRDQTQVPEAELLRLDTCGAASVGLGGTLPIHAAHLQARHLWLALRAGEPHRLAVALTYEAHYASFRGNKSQTYVDAVLGKARALAEQAGDPYGLAMAHAAEGTAALLQGRFPLGDVAMRRALVLLRERCTGVTRELDDVSAALAANLSLLGELRELSSFLPPLIRDVSERRNRALEVRLRLSPGVIVRLAADAVEAARGDLRMAAELGSAEGFHLNSALLVMARARVALYEADGPSAWRGLQEGWGALRRSGLLHVQAIRVDALCLRALSAVACAAEGTARDLWLRRAARDARRLEREGAPWAGALALGIRAQVARAEGRAQEALALIDAAEHRVAEVGMRLQEHVARRRRGEWLGEAGRELVAQADAWMEGQSIRAPARMTGMLLGPAQVA